jgi:hypothetical protein
VLGGGNTAMDCCRKARRGGADVKVVVRSGFDETKSSPWEKEDSIREGVAIVNFLAPKVFAHAAGRLTGVVFEKMAAKKDESGHRVLMATDVAGHFRQIRRRADCRRPGKRISLDRKRRAPDRLLRKFETARSLLPRPVLQPAAKPTCVGDGSTAPAVDEAQALLARDGLHVDTLRIRAFPLALEVAEFVCEHDQVFVVEQNRDAQTRTLMTTDLELAPAELTSILHFGGMPITARFIVREITGRLRRPGFGANVGARFVTYLGKPKFRHPTIEVNDSATRAATTKDRCRRYAPAVGTTRSAQRSSRPLRIESAAASDGQAERHRLLLQDADLRAGSKPRFQLGVRRYPRCSRAPISPTATSSISAFLATAIPRRSGSANSPIRCGGASTWSTTSRITACTGF